MVSVPLTPVECARCTRVLDAIRRQLFRHHSPVDYFIVLDSERVIPAYAESRWNAACGDYRVVHWGGLSYSIDCGDSAGLSKFFVSHEERDRFNFWLTAAKGHTLNSLVVRFRSLEEVPYSYVSSHRRACVNRKPYPQPPAPTTGKAKRI